MTAQLTLCTLLTLTPAVGPPGPSWHLEVGLTGDQLKTRLFHLRAAGYQPTCVSGYNVGEDSRFALVWGRANKTPWVVDFGLTPAGLDRRGNERSELGFRPVGLSGYDLVGDQGFIDLWRQDGGPAWSVEYGKDADGLRQLAREMRKRDYWPRSVSSYVSGTISRYATIWEKGGDVAWELRWGLSGSEFSQALNDLSSQGYRPVAVAGLGVELEDRFAAVWVKRKGPAWLVRYGLDERALGNLQRTMRFQGYRPVYLTGYATLNGTRFATIWERDPSGS